MNKAQKAFIFDMNGTMIDDMDFHNKIWFEIITEELGGKLTTEEVKAQMYGKNSELLERVFGPGRFSTEEMNWWSLEKEKRYQKAYLPHLRLLPGLDEFFENAFINNIPMGLGSAAITFNVDFVLENLSIRHYFKAVVTADDVKTSKPHPETFLKVAKKLQKQPSDCIVFEDAPKGVEAAQNAGMECVVVLSAHEKQEFKQYKNVLFMIEDYKDKQLTSLLPR